VQLRVFIQNETGSDVKNRHNEKTLQFLRSERVSRTYPFPYGFIIGTTASDGLNLDCFVITERALKTGEIVDCEPIALMEQIEDGKEDHNVLARLRDESPGVTPAIESVLTDFVQHVFDHVDGKQISAGRFLGVESARTHIRRCKADL